MRRRRCLGDATVSIEVRPLSGAVGAEILGVDIGEDLSDAQFADTDSSISLEELISKYIFEGKE